MLSCTVFDLLNHHDQVTLLGDNIEFGEKAPLKKLRKLGLSLGGAA
jgi:hypothetical protein